MAAPPPPHKKVRQEYVSTQLQGEARILHALNRFTFGPRPGDLEVVRSIGLDNWFEQQLHPESLDLSDLNTRLAEYPAMQWSTADLLYRLPSNTLIRQAINGRLTIPDHGILRTIYENEMARVEARQEKKKEDGDTKQQTASGAGASAGMASSGAGVMAGNTPDTANTMAMAAPSDVAIQDANVLSSAEIDAMLDLDPAQRITRLASYTQPQLDGMFKSLRPIQRLQLVAGMEPAQKEIVAALENPERLVAEELIAVRLTRDLYSSAQLQEVMTDFWLNHFNVYLRKNETMPYELVSYERDVIRPHALGKFEDLLEATAHSPAMLMYLDNNESIGPDSLAAERMRIAVERHPGLKKAAREGLNENYARELMELHTVGVNGGYTQADVTQVARILTGWTIDQPQRGGGFEFNPNRHDPGTKTVFGQKVHEDGEMEGRALLHYLATRPATAQFICRKLAIRFVSDDPPQSLVDRMAQTYLTSGGDISAVLRTLFHSPEFWSTSAYHAKVKTPLEYVLSAVRASNARIDNLRPLANALREMGMPLYGCVPPTGYNDDAATWVSTGALVDRMNFALNLAANRLPGVTVAWNPSTDNSIASTLSTGQPSPETEEARLEALLLAGGLSDTTRSAVLQQFQQQMMQNPEGQPARAVPVFARAGAFAPSALEREDQILAGLLLGSPEFQRR
ncbi:MAG TPA: DUF1800 domain-containing protein [Terracidiphilus sp.]|nr:DUF1800 domain-containing protein [Terracidiphilus sp.]